MNIIKHINHKKQYDFIVVGAGPAGSTFAAVMADCGHHVLVVDRRSHIAGNTYTELQDKIHVHKYGAHIFHTNHDNVWKFVRQFADFSDYKHQVVAIDDANSLFQMPFNMMTFTQLFPDCVTVAEVKNKIAWEIAKEKHINEPANLEEQALSLVGRTVYETLIKGYTEKQWGKKCTELPASIIKRLPIRMNYDSTYFSNAKHQGIPIGGYTKMFENMLTNANIDVLLKTSYTDIAQGIGQNLIKKPRKIIYTGAIDELCDFRFEQLEYRSLQFKSTLLDTDNYQGTSVVNYTGQSVEHTRVIEHRHFDTECESDKTLITHEYSEDFMFGKNEPYYPINDTANQHIYDQYAKLVADKYPDMLLVGRLAEYKYYDMDAVIKCAGELAKETDNSIT